jgi:tetratricopeptide (TPR) repeat protein
MNGRNGTIGVLLLLAVTVAGCGGGGTSGPEGEPTGQELVAEGWEAFESADWTEALARFQAALSADTVPVDAYSGLGWTYASVDSLRLALGFFDAAIGAGDPTADPYAGKAIVLRESAPPDYAGAVIAATEALVRSPRYRFAHDETFDWRDLHLLLAQCSFALTWYEEAGAHVDSLGGTVPDPSSHDYVEELSLEIEELASGIAGT